MSDDEEGLLEEALLPRAPPPSVVSEAWDLLKLGVPIFVSMTSWVGMKTTDTALLGHVGTHYLSARCASVCGCGCDGHACKHNCVPNQAEAFAMRSFGRSPLGAVPSYPRS